MFLLILNRGDTGCENGLKDDDGKIVVDKPMCGHFILSHTQYGYICGVEFHHMGQHTTIGRYPFHMHMAGNAPKIYFGCEFRFQFFSPPLSPSS